MPTIKDKSGEVLSSIEKHSEKIGSEELHDACLSNAKEVAEDIKTTDADMVKTVPYSIAIPRHEEEDEPTGPGRDQSPVPAPPTTAEHHSGTPAEKDIPAGRDIPGEEDILIPSRPSSAAPTRFRSAGKSKSPAAEVVKAKAKVETVPPHNDLLNLYSKSKSPVRNQQQQKPISFRELTAEFDRMLKPLSQQLAAQSTHTSNDDWYYDTSGECDHPVLAVEPRNPATPPNSFKIHKQRTVVKPGYTYLEPVLLDVPLSPECGEQGIDNLLDIAERMKPIPPRIDNFTHYPPSRHLLKPSYYSPRVHKPVPKHIPPLNGFSSISKCSSSSIEM